MDEFDRAQKSADKDVMKQLSKLVNSSFRETLRMYLTDFTKSYNYRINDRHCIGIRTEGVEPLSEIWNTCVRIDKNECMGHLSIKLPNGQYFNCVWEGKM